MKVALIWLGVLYASCLLLFSTSCQTATPGVKDSLGSYVVMVDAAPLKVTKAARSSVEDLKLADIDSFATAVDGKVTAKTAQGQDVRIDVEEAGDNVSRVTVHVGATGDEDISQKIIDRIRKNV